MVESWVSEVAFVGEDIGESYCYTMDRTYFQEDLLDYELRSNPCDLFIVMQASDFVLGERRGNMFPQYPTLDRKFSDGTYDYGSVGGDAVMGYVVIDHKPWGGPWGDEGEREIVSDWPDPNYKQSPYGMSNDWCPEETSIVWWNLTGLLRDRPDTVDIRVRLTDNTLSPTTGYKGNWTRSGNVLEQVSYAANRAKARFVNDNPYDHDLNWKIVKYEGNTGDWETSFIYNRSMDGLANGKVSLDYFIMVEPDGEGALDPRITMNQIPVKFSSTETRFPPGCADNIVVFANLITQYDPILSEIPGGYARLDELFEPESVCPLYYHTRITVSDSNITDAGNNILYVSSNDHLLPIDQRLDSTMAIGKDYEDYGAQTHFTFGTRRGKGSDTPSIQDKIWYSHDEMIVNSGFEIVEAEIQDSNLNLVNHSDIYRHVPVQSEADVVVIMAHSLSIRFGEDGPKYYTPTITKLFSPYYWNIDLSHHDNLRRLVSYYDQSGNPACITDSRCSDFGVPEGPTPEFGYGYGDFWLKTADETRWLVLWSCAQMSNLGIYPPKTHWKESIDKGYMNSVAGFSTPFNPVYDIDTSLLSNYGTRLTNLLISNNYNYTPLNYVYTQNDMWIDDGGIHYTRDLSVAAWMEASVISASRATRYRRYKELRRHKSEAIAYDHLHQCYYNWRLWQVKSYGRFFGPKYSYKIKRYPI